MNSDGDGVGKTEKELLEALEKERTARHCTASVLP
jgi:hypothetical protein